MRIFPILLFLISGAVVITLAKKQNAWSIIVLYWVVLTIKNLVEVFI